MAAAAGVLPPWRAEAAAIKAAGTAAASRPAPVETDPPGAGDAAGLTAGAGAAIIRVMIAAAKPAVAADAAARATDAPSRPESVRVGPNLFK